MNEIIKACSKCKEEKPRSAFFRSKAQTDGCYPSCKSCNASRHTRYREEHRSEAKTYFSEYKRSNLEKVTAKNRTYRTENKEKETARATTWRKENKDKLNAQKRLRYNNDPVYRFKYTLRKAPNRIISIFKCKGQAIEKKDLGHLEEYLGCSVQDLIPFLEQKFTSGMTWNNYGNKQGQWSVDHIIPLAQATTKEDALKLSHFTNLQPLWHIDNLSKRDRLVCM